MVGIVWLYGLLCSLPLRIGTPLLKVDYPAWLSDHTRAGREETLNAKPCFDKAAELVRDNELIEKALAIAAMQRGDMNEPQRRILADLAERNAKAFEILRQGVTRPYYWIQYGAYVNEPLPELPPARLFGRPYPLLSDIDWAFGRVIAARAPGYRNLAQVFRASIAWRAYQGDVAGALDDCLVLMDFGMHLEGRGMQAEQLVGLAIEGLGNYAAFTLLDSHDIPGSDLTRIQSRLTELYDRHETIIDVMGNRAAWLALVERTFTDDGRGNGHVLKEGIPLAVGDWKDSLASFWLFRYPDRKEIVSRIDRFWNEYQLALEAEPSHPDHQERKARWMALAQESSLLGEAVPGMDRISVQVWRVKASRRALLTTVAVMRYAENKGGYPTTLDALIADGYMNQLPIDPYRGQSFGYRRTQDGFLLYSRGDDLTDDGGQPGTGQGGKPRRQWTEKGDWVFWPVGE